MGERAAGIVEPETEYRDVGGCSNDGNLVVAVSSNSEEWLKKKSTVDALSDAAQKPLMESDPDWAKSATDMMNQISVQKKTSTSSRTIWIGVEDSPARCCFWW